MGTVKLHRCHEVDEALVEVEKAANFKLQPVKEVFVIELLQDSRFKVLQDQEIVALAEIPIQNTYWLLSRGIRWQANTHWTIWPTVGGKFS